MTGLRVAHGLRRHQADEAGHQLRVAERPGRPQGLQQEDPRWRDRRDQRRDQEDRREGRDRPDRFPGRHRDDGPRLQEVRGGRRRREVAEPSDHRRSLRRRRDRGNDERDSRLPHLLRRPERRRPSLAARAGERIAGADPDHRHVARRTG